VLLLWNVRTRTRLVQVGMAAGLAYAVMTLATGLLTNQTGQLIAFDMGRHFAWGSLAGFLLCGSLPLVERCFGMVTDVSLLELAVSTLVIIGHVKDGVALARQYGVPRPIIDFIEQHHGTTLVEYFYREALRLQGNHGYGPEELEPTFRYPGPKPQNRESGIVM